MSPQRNILNRLKKRKIYFFKQPPSFLSFCRLNNIDPQRGFIICDQKFKE